MGKLYTIRDACKILQLNPNTLRKWDREGKIRCVRLSNNFRRVPESEINRIPGIKNNRMSFIYARVSSHDQKADLDTQTAEIAEAYQESTEAQQKIEAGQRKTEKKDKGCFTQTVHHNSERTS